MELGVAGRADHVSTQLEENFLCISKDTQEHYQIQENMSLCTGCQKLSITNIRDEAEGEGQEIYTHSVATFNCAIADNCYFCTRVQKEMPGEVRNQLYDTDCPGIRCSITKNGSTYGVDFCIPGRQLIAYFRLGDKFGKAILLIAVVSDGVDNFTQDFGFEKFSHTTDHETCWKRIAGWYKTCKTAHIRCHKSLQLPGVEKWLPTRLLDTEEANQGRVKVIPTADIEVSEREMTSYLVLSHCWGKRSFITLNQDNKARLQDSFSLDELPPNFRDAANATRRLGFRYVWIDSLCIIQGADGDWAEQAPLMDKVYMNAELCLAAAASSDAYGGFFRQREPEDIQPFKIDLLLSEPGSLENPTPRTFYAYCRGEVPILIWTAAVTSSPLNHRGWVQQERVLAPRTIHFSHQQACWECKELQAYEAGPDDAMEEFGSQTIKDWETRGPETVAFHQARDGLSPLPQDIYEAWRRVISQYSTCALSFERDTLVAASGMAKAFARHLGEDYAAGLWKGHLVQELLWSRAARGETRRHKEYRAPTWSWASVAGPVEWRPQGRNVQDIAKVRAVRVETCTADATGEVKYAELVLSGYLVAQSRAEGKNMFKAIDVDGEETAMSPDGCALAPLCTTVVGNMWKKTEGFLLTAAGGGANGTYRRLGLFVVTARTTDEWYDTKDTVEFTII